MNWTLKIAAYLSKSPACALFPEKDREIAHRLMQTACGENYSEDLRQEAASIDLIAAGMDIPPFIEKLDGACFRKKPVLTHPLSGQEHQLTLPSDLTPEQVSDHIENTLGDMVGKVGVNSQKDLFFTLWRQFSEELNKNDPTGIGCSWKNLPADARIPSHTIWEHASVSSAIAGAWPDPSIFIFTIASAQDMVATARRTQDAWMGSFLWSYLSWQAIKVIAEKCGPDAVISPSLKGQPIADLWLNKDLNLQMVHCPGNDLLEIGNIPNMFTAIVPYDQAKSLAQECEKAVQDAWKEIAKKVKKAVEDAYQAAPQQHQADMDICSWDAIWHRQSEAFVHNQGIFWVICPWGKDHNGVIEAKKGGDHISEELKDLENILKNMQQNGSDSHIGMVYHLLSSFAGTELTARKNLRDFKQAVEPGHKCSLCGKWEVVHPSSLANSTSYADLRSFWEELSSIGRIDRTKGNLKLAGRIRRGEMLCSICLTRRLALEACFEAELGLDHHMFPSTAGIATAAYRGRLLEKCNLLPNLASALKDYVVKLEPFIKKHHFPYPAASTNYLTQCAGNSGTGDVGKKFLQIDGDWLTSGTYEETLQREDATITKEEIDKCKNSAGKVVGLANELGLGSLPGYYAILALDGDHMGNWVTGTKDHAPNYRWLMHPDVRKEELITNIMPSEFKRPPGPAMQLALSDSLKNFSLTFARDIVEKDHAGKLVYAGGDDLLAFLPTEHLLSAMISLYTCFRGIKDGYGEKDGEILRLAGGVRTKDSGEINHEGVTVSMGIVIVHHSYPLYHAMQEAQAVLKDTAKKKFGRNAFAIRLLRRSGESTEGGWKFNNDVNSDTGDVLKLFGDIVKYIKDDRLSGRLPYTMKSHRWAGGEDQDLDHARRTELARITTRHILKTSPEEQMKIKQSVLKLFDVINDHRKDIKEGINTWDMTARLLLILRFMAGKER